MQERLNNLSMLSIECDIAEAIEFKVILNDFANKKDTVICNYMQKTTNIYLLCQAKYFGKLEKSINNFVNA